MTAAYGPMIARDAGGTDPAFAHVPCGAAAAVTVRDGASPAHARRDMASPDARSDRKPRLVSVPSRRALDSSALRGLVRDAALLHAQPEAIGLGSHCGAARRFGEGTPPPSSGQAVVGRPAGAWGAEA